jgi:hypothetical protein
MVSDGSSLIGIDDTRAVGVQYDWKKVKEPLIESRQTGTGTGEAKTRLLDSYIIKGEKCELCPSGDVVEGRP